MIFELDSNQNRNTQENYEINWIQKTFLFSLSLLINIFLSYVRGQICCPNHVHKLFREVFSSGFSHTKNKYKMYKKKTSTKTMYLFVEIIYFCKKQIHSVELFCRSFVEFKNCRRFFSHFCRNKNVVLTLFL